MLFLSLQKLFSFLRYSIFWLVFLVIYRKGLIKKIRINFKFYDDALWLTNSCNTNIAQYFKISDFVLMLAWSNFLLCAFVTMIYCTSTELLLNLVAPLDSALSSLDFEKISIFWTSRFQSVSIVFDSLSVSPNCISHIRFKWSFFWAWENRYMVHGFDSISITQFPAMIFSVSLEASLSRVALELCFTSLWLSILLLSTLMRQLTYNVGITSLVPIFGLDI